MQTEHSYCGARKLCYNNIHKKTPKNALSVMYRIEIDDAYRRRHNGGDNGVYLSQFYYFVCHASEQVHANNAIFLMVMSLVFIRVDEYSDEV